MRRFTQLVVTLLCFAIFLAGAQHDEAIVSALSQRHFGEALQAIDLRLKTGPADARLWMMRGAALYGLQRTKDSLTAYRKAVQLQPNLMPALQAEAQLEYTTRDPAARATLTKILSLDSPNQVAHAMLGVLAFEAKDCAGAVQHFDNAPQQVSQEQASLQQYGFCLLQLNRGAEAASVFERLLSTDESDARVRLNLTLALAGANQPARAIEVLKPLWQSASPEPDVLGLLGELYRANQQTEEAIAAFRRGIQLYPKEERLYIGLAALCSYYNSGELSLEVLDVGLKNIPGSSRLYAMRGVINSQTGQREKSMADFERASELSPAEQYGRTGLALSMLQEGRIDDLIRNSRESLKRKPNDANANFMLAQALIRKGAQKDEPAFLEARTALEKALRVDPQFDQARALLGKMYFTLGKTTLAIRELEAALVSQPANRVAIYQLMLAYEAAGREHDASLMQDRMKATIEKEREEEVQRNRIRLMKVPDQK